MGDDRSASMLELKAIDAPHGHYDVAILGGGLAGLTIAIQLKRERPETRVLVTDKRTEPAPEAAFKVGESSVEIGAYYYREVIGMRDHLEKFQQRKLGLRFYMPAGDNSDITKRVEFCTPGHLDAFTHTPSAERLWVAVRTVKSRALRAHKRFAAMLGYAPDELIGRSAVLRALTPESLEAPIPEPFAGRTMAARELLMHLYGHLNYHLGQVDYVRRVVTGEGAIPLAG